MGRKGDEDHDDEREDNNKHKEMKWTFEKILFKSLKFITFLIKTIIIIIIIIQQKFTTTPSQKKISLHQILFKYTIKYF